MGAAIIKGKLDGHAASSVNRHTDEAFSRLKETNLQNLSHSTVGTVACLRLSFSRELGRKKAIFALITWICHTSISSDTVVVLSWCLQTPASGNLFSQSISQLKTREAS